MSDLRELYQEVIIDHGRRPRNFGRLENPSHMKEGFNPLCGDKLMVYCRAHDGKIDEIMFEGEGCAISMASASMMTEALRGKPIAEFDTLFKNFHQLVTGGSRPESEKLGKLVVLGGVAEFPARVKCATLAWHTAQAMVHNENREVSTE